MCHYWYFLNKAFKFQPNVCNGCHDSLMISKDFRNIIVLNIKGADYRCVICIISGISKSEVINVKLKILI